MTSSSDETGPCGSWAVPDWAKAVPAAARVKAARPPARRVFFISNQFLDIASKALLHNPSITLFTTQIVYSTALLILILKVIFFPEILVWIFLLIFSFSGHII
jgi:hypothetical protein